MRKSSNIPRAIAAAARGLAAGASAGGSHAELILGCGGELGKLIRPNGVLDPHLCGIALETLIAGDGDRRRKTGAFYTPPWLVDHVLDVCLEQTLDELTRRREGSLLDEALLSVRVCDPACGSGNFLLAAAQRIAARSPRLALGAVLDRCIFGVDVNRDAVALCRACLESHGGSERIDEHVVAGDAVRGRWPGSGADGDGIAWERVFPDVFEAGGFDVVVGNPPYLNQLESATVESRAAAEHLKEVSGGMIAGYADLAAAFWLLASKLVKPAEGRFALVLPGAVLSSRDAGRVRGAIGAECAVEHVYAAPARAFGASVQTIVVACRRGRPESHTILRSAGQPVRRVVPLTVSGEDLPTWPTWSPLRADQADLPKITITSAGVVGDMAHATADFRDEYYGLEGFIVDALEADDREFPPLITSGLIDLAAHRWGRTPTRILKRKWLAPRLDLRRMRAHGTLGDWAARRLVPKVIVATQTRVMECIADPEGKWLPVTPLISVMPRDPADVWLLAAVIGSPVATLVAAQRFGGAALHADAIKLSAKQVLELPLPVDRGLWQFAATVLKEGVGGPALVGFTGAVVPEAYGGTIEEGLAVWHWWFGRLGPMKAFPWGGG
ncbi:MAG: N-6 DNA methylase [Phycisphaerales bacterium]